jgi:hypothetical protein
MLWPEVHPATRQTGVKGKGDQNTTGREGHAAHGGRKTAHGLINGNKTCRTARDLLLSKHLVIIYAIN